jgi:arylsulfatase A-like enzyme
MRDDFSARGIFLDQCITQAGWTYPSAACFLTGKTAARCGVSNITMSPGAQTTECNWAHKTVLPALLPSHRTIFDLLHEANYAIRSFSGKILMGEYPYERWHRSPEHFVDNVGQALSWLAARDERPFFLFYRTIATHIPWIQLPQFSPWRTGLDMVQHWAENGYRAKAEKAMDSALQYFDRETYRPIRAWLQNRNLWEDTVIVIMSDHGDSVWENLERREHFDTDIGGARIGHFNCFEENIHVPAGIIVPGEAPQIRSELTRLVDLLPTVLGALELATPSDLDGRDLLSDTGGGGAAFAPCEAGPSVALRTATHKFIYHVERREQLLFDLRADPDEKRPLASPELTEHFLGMLREYLGEQNLDRLKTLEAALVREQLRGLGYL